MENAKESKKIIIISVVCIILTSFIVASLSYAQYISYTRQYNNALNALCNELENEYPNISEEKIMDILESDSLDQKSIFDKYGIDLNNTSVLRQNEYSFKKYVVIDIAVVVVFGLLLSTFIYLSHRKNQKELYKIATYLKNINDGDYNFDMEDMMEGNISILEAEVYKTTIMLKESADNSLLDKMKLKEALSDISHQLKTPLTSLSINLENLQELKDLNENDRQSLIMKAKRDTDRISQMVKQLLTLSKFDANVIEFKKEDFRLCDIVYEAIDNVEALADLRCINIINNLSEDSNAIIQCDSYWEKQAITNILKNGVEHAKSQVIINYANYELYKEIVIENDGDAINENDIRNIFERFYSGEHATKDSVGIGLSLANAIVKNDSGYINVESDKTTRFIIRYM